MGELLLLIVVATAAWVYFDASSIGARKGLLTGIADMGPAGWALATLLLWIIAFPLYLAKRGEIREAVSRQPKPPRRGGPFTGR